MRVLVADDDPLSLHMVVYRLQRWGHEVSTCTDGETAWEILQSEDPPHVAILDWMMPKLDGLQVCQNVRKRSANPYIYLILLTGKDDTDDMIAGLESGADDYLRKPFHLGELEARLRSGKRIVDLQAELLATQEILRIQATQDPLTHVLNHGAIFDCLHRELARAQREQLPLSLIMVDVDDFKIVNDTYGHLAGDQVLIEVTQRLQSCLRPYDVIGRYGGEEFLLILPNSDVPTAQKQATRLQASLSKDPILLDHVEIPITISQGVTTWMMPYVADSQALIHVADSALYLVKREGRNGIETMPYDKEERPIFLETMHSPLQDG